jgi:deazaflavin-dependent oxidoreductase (nitroreductase family)
VPLPASLGRFNRVVTNRVTRPVARWLPGFGVVEHTGRRSGRSFRTPVNAFRHGSGVVVALTYGRDADWVRNVLAAGGCRMERRGGVIALGSPEVVVDPAATLVPGPVRPILRLLDVDHFLVMARA